eukprot:1016661-Rhodomonas_salina.1
MVSSLCDTTGSSTPHVSTNHSARQYRTFHSSSVADRAAQYQKVRPAAPSLASACSGWGLLRLVAPDLRQYWKLRSSCVSVLDIS